MTYVPHALTLNGHLQAAIYIIVELLYVKLRQPLKYDRELFKLSDGGIIAIDWHIDEQGGIPNTNGRGGRNSSPILVCFSGLSGGNDNLYLYSIIRSAT
jgi:predicted alpha/beta-fold hydrolase